MLAAHLQAQPAPRYSITTIAGTGVAGFAGDAAAASAAQLNFPVALARGSSGILYVADLFNRRIRTIGTDGVIRTVSGNGINGISGDGGAATSAQMGTPYGVAVDAAGNFYFCDALNSIIRKVTSAGTISRFAGTGARGFGGDGAAAVDAVLNLPTGITVDASGNVYFADTSNHRIRRIGADGKISTVAGNGAASFRGDGGQATNASLNRPEGVALDSAGNIYIADTVNHRIRKVGVDGVITTVAGSGNNTYNGDTGPATLAALNYPKNVAVGAAGDIFIADTFNSRIRQVTEDGRIWTIAGNGQFGDFTPEGGDSSQTLLRFPAGLQVGAGGALYIADTDNSRIKLLTPVPTAPVVQAGGVISLSGFGGSARAAQGSWVEIYGANLAPGTRVWAAEDFVNDEAPTTLGGTTVTIAGQPAFISFVSPGQVNVLIPDTVPEGPQDLIVTTGLGSSPPYQVTVDRTEPGMLAPAVFSANGMQYIGAFAGDGSVFVLPEGLVDGVIAHPARPGDIITLYGIGFGPVVPDVLTGQIPRAAAATTLPVEVYIGGQRAFVTYAGIAPGALGLYQFNVVVPVVPAGSAVPITFKLGQEEGVQTLFTAIGN